MGKIIYLLLSFLIMTNNLFANNNELLLTRELSQSLALINSNANIWPKFKISSKPIIVYFSNQHHYAYYFSPINSNWKIQSDQSFPVYFLDHDEYEIDNLSWSDGNIIDGQPSFVFGLETIKDISNRDILHLLFHERFHIFQFEDFPVQIYNFGTYTGFNQIENVKLTYIEDLALGEYLTNDNIEALKDYVAINQYRQKLMGDISTIYEATKENMEGIADYYGWSVAISNEAERNQAMITTYKNKCGIDKLIKCQLQDRYYFTGAAVGIALDNLSVGDWKDKLVKNKSFIRNQLHQYFSFSDTQISQRVNQAKERYNYAEITRPIEVAIERYKERRSKEMNSYNNQPGVKLNIERRPCNLFGMTMADENFYIDSNIQLYINQIGNSSCPDHSIIVNYFNIPYVLKTENIGRIQVKIDNDTLLEIDGKSISAKDLSATDTAIDFNNLYLKNTVIEIEIKNRSARLDIKGNELNLITNFDKE
ncbi:hypothetical protein [Legionella quateirensis]|nr:hypothetical protein [Legionella quateirensis]